MSTRQQQQQQHKIGSGFGANSPAVDVRDGISLQGRTALVTGGCSGLGLEITRALSRAGAQLIVPARRPATAREALRDVPRVEVRSLNLRPAARTARTATSRSPRRAGGRA
ncbi:SDR family NAD(P)-dependent oxidoreductase [Streptomyces sp. NPDC021622]|uniref:SDR family NAD(P)-dependent oxidoreductase n=1 Tax=Streptomyces sp. NPDC021622 TaxID=3155013 RepID=UPI0033D743F9